MVSPFDKSAVVPGRPHDSLVLLCPGFSHLALPMVTEPLFVANWLTGRDRFGWRLASADGLAVRTSSGAAVAVDQPLTADDRADTVFVLASFDARRSAADPRVTGWLRRMARRSEIAGIETGSEVVAAAGLFEGRRVAVHWYNIEGFRERFPGTRPVVARAETQGRVPSSAGAAATLDLMLALIAREAGPALAAEVGRHLLATSDPDAPPPGRRAEAPGDPVVARTLALIEERLAEPRDCAALARDLGLSLRQLQRRFGAAEGRAPGAAWREAQFARAHQLVQQTDLTLTEIAMATGFGSLEAFSRAYRRRFGIAPSRDRGQSTDGSVFAPLV